MPLVKDIYSYIDSIAPFETQAEFDNSGLLLGDMDMSVKKVMLALDVTEDVVNEAKDNGCELIISHHPVIFAPLYSISENSVINKLIKAELSVLCAHTNLDKAQEIGVNQALANSLGLRDTVLYKEDYLCVGSLEHTMTDKEFALHVKAALNCKGTRYTKGNVIKTVAVSSGAGSEAVTLKDKYHFDALVTGELKHHHFLEAKASSLCAVEAGHFNTENIVLEPLKNKLSQQFNDTVFLLSKTCGDVVEFA